LRGRLLRPRVIAENEIERRAIRRAPDARGAARIARASLWWPVASLPGAIVAASIPAVAETQNWRASRGLSPELTSP